MFSPRFFRSTTLVGGEDYDSVKENTLELNVIFDRLVKDGLEVQFIESGRTIIRTVLVVFTAGGDMKWLTTIMGMKGYEYAI